MPTGPTLDQLRCHAVARTLFRPTTLPGAITRLGFVQADPIRAPARAQDLTLRHRVAGYRAGDLERRYPRMAIEEDFFVNYGFLPRATQALMHPRTARDEWSAARRQQARAVLDFVREREVVHPRDVDAHFAHGRVTNWFGGAGKASTHLLDAMHFRGLLRVARRDAGIRLYAVREAPGAVVDAVAAFDALLDVIVDQYAPLPAASLGQLASRLCVGVPQWIHLRAAALERLKQRLPSARIDGQLWYWPAGENPASKRHAVDDVLRLLAPFDPIVWDRRRFEAFWGWAYRFEAYTPPGQRVRGYYALPMLWRGEVIGWSNLAVTAGRLDAEVGFADGRAPSGRGFDAALDDELQRITAFLGLA